MTRLRAELSRFRISVDRHLHLIPRMKLGGAIYFDHPLNRLVVLLREPVVMRQLAR
jgi:hypothetical protein